MDVYKTKKRQKNICRHEINIFIYSRND